MLIEYTKSAPLCRAILQTFDGAHPCSLCHVVGKGKNSEKKQDLDSPASKIDMICASFATGIVQPFVPFEYAAGDSFSFEFGLSPPVPPPRLLLHGRFGCCHLSRRSNTQRAFFRLLTLDIRRQSLRRARR